MTDDRMPWFPCYQSKLLGALAGMDPDCGYVYTVVLLRTYEVRGACPDNSAVLSRRTGLSVKRVEKALGWLVEIGKLHRSEAGLENPFALEILTDCEEKHSRLKKNGKRGGEKSAEIRKQNQRIEASQASSKTKPGSTHLQLQLQEQEVSKKVRTPPPPKGGDGWPSDYLEVFWKLYPPYRRSAKKTVAAKLAVIRKAGDVPWAVLIAGLQRYVDSNPGEYAKGPVVWLNGGCWEDEPVHRAPRKSGNGYAALLREVRERNQEGFDGFDGNGGPIIDAEPVGEFEGSRRY